MTRASCSTSAPPRPGRRTSRTCSSGTATSCGERHPLPRRPLRRALPRRPRPDAAAVGRAGDRGRRRVGPAGRRGPRWRGTAIISHEILATASRAQVGRALDVARPRPGHRGARGALGARPGPPDPGRVAGERQAPQRTSPTPGSSSRSATPTARAGSATWFWGVQEIPDILDRWGADLPPERSTWSPCRRRARRRPAVEALRPGLRTRRASTSTSTTNAQPLARRPRDRADPPDQPARPTGRGPARLPPAGARAARPPDAVAPRASTAAGAAARTRLGRRARRPGSPRSRARVRRVGDLDDLLPAPRRCTRTSTPTARRERRGRRRRPRRDQGPAPRERPVARRRGRPARSSTRPAPALDAVLPAAVVPRPREGP